MHRRIVPPLGLLLLVGLFLSACRGEAGPAGPVGPAGPAGPVGPPGPAGSDATASQTFLGAEECGECHEAIYAQYSLSGHPHILTRIEGGQPPEFPHDTLTGGVPDPPEGYTWDDITYVIGGFAWKALFVDAEGYLVAGEEGANTQYNLANERLDAAAGWVPYHPDEAVDQACWSCHTTGYMPQGHQDNLEGIAGSWELDGVQCEACHGPGSRHAADPQGVSMSVDRSSQLCGSCHAREDKAQMAATGVFELPYQQYADLYNSRHFALDCIDCHDPHASAVLADEELNPNRGLRQACEACHWAQEAVQNNRQHLGVDCADCHMPPMVVSAQAIEELFTADLHAHQFSINPDPAAPQFSEDGQTVMPYLTLRYACGHCHNGETGTSQDLETLAVVARGYHTPLTPTPEPSATPEGNSTATPEASS